MPLRRAAVHALSLVILGLPACASAAEPAWLAEARAREGKPLPEVVVKSEDGWFRAKLPAKVLEKIVLDENSYGISLDIGAQEQANCEVLREGFDLAALLRSTAEISFTRLAEVQGKIESRELERIDAGAYGESPYIALDWVYLVQSDGKPMLGALKQIAATKGDFGIYCAHTDVGYSRTFESVVRALVESIEVKEPGPAPYYAEISTLSIGDRRIGVSTTTLVRDADGDSKLVTATSMIAPVTAAEVQAHDSYEIEFIRPDGTLINAKSVSADNGEIDVNLALGPADEGWLIEGEMNGKKLKQALPAAPQPHTFVQEAAMRRALLAQEKPAGAEAKYWTWIDADPLRFTAARVEVVGPVDDGFAVRESAGPLTVDAVVDPASGTGHRATIAIGANTFAVNRILVRGRL